MGWSAVLRQVYDTYSVIHECKTPNVFDGICFPSYLSILIFHSLILLLLRLHTFFFFSQCFTFFILFSVHTDFVTFHTRFVSVFLLIHCTFLIGYFAFLFYCTPSENILYVRHTQVHVCTVDISLVWEFLFFFLLYTVHLSFEWTNCVCARRRIWQVLIDKHSPMLLLLLLLDCW